jgi:hypothetical protein
MSESSLLTIPILDIIHRPVFYLNATFQKLHFISAFRWNILRWIQNKGLASVSDQVPKRPFFQIKDRMMDNVENGVSLSQTHYFVVDWLFHYDDTLHNGSLSELCAAENRIQRFKHDWQKIYIISEFFSAFYCS